MFAAQTNPFILLCSSLQKTLSLPGGSRQKPDNQNSQGAEDPRHRLQRVLGEMLPSTVDEVAQAAEMELPTAQAYLTELATRSKVMFNPLTKRYSLPKFVGDSSFAA